ncbi:TIGR01244 family sulfur transferase [Rubellimicrobium sp. CFH 75288]|uniref:TIGR01244 family sulfur transferase n=1 Tax=Rubellimicrobium sp. CFH 75288 TaxID=2697034 RepID=UPI0014134626|nr:TIGR01244 family sulfur transferase [Rubellimicrobium sp. CFH 75288]NAZ37007.1 TIGR01244 family phosphatase [Rubellimicrobium sp. CFH 75288]
MTGRTGPETLTFGGQIAPEEVAALAARGVRAIICNRPDGEEPGQPPFAAIAAEAARHRIATCHIPVRPGAETEDDARAFAAALREMPGPVFAFCRSGGRARKLAAMAAQRPDGTERTPS